jgi:hemolysin activation/secretion protein
MTYKVTAGESASLNLTGDTQSFGLNLSHPFYRSRTYNLSGVTSAEKKNFQNKSSSVIQSKYNTTTIGVGSNFDLVTNYLYGGQLSTSVNYYLANNNYDDSPQTFRQNKISERTDGYINKLSTNLNYNQFISENLTGIVKFTGQLSDRNLDSSQKIYLGGAEGVRAYPSSEGSGANGYILNVDLKASVTDGVKFKVFYDYATAQQYVENSNTSTGASISGTKPNIFSLQGYGVGFDGNFYGAEFNLFAAKRINNNPLRNTNDTDSNGAPSRTNLWGKVSYSF